MHQSVEPEVRTDGERVGSPHIMFTPSHVWLDEAYTGQKESKIQDLCPDTILSFMHQPVEPKVWTDEKKVRNPHIL